MSQFDVWKCPECETTFIGYKREELIDHFTQCAKPPMGYEGYVHLGVKGKYRSEIEQLFGRR